MNATKIDTHVADAQSRLLEQYQGRPNFAALLAVLVRPVQSLEDEIFGIAAANSLAQAEGVQLDIIGSVVGVERNGLSDPQYVALLRGTVAQNNGDATIEDILTIVRGLFATDAVFLKTPDSYPRGPQVAAATVSLAVGDPSLPPEVFAVVESSVRAALGAGVSLNYLGRFNARAGAFAFAGGQPWVRGLGSITDETAGGALGSLLSNNPNT